MQLLLVTLLFWSLNCWASSDYTDVITSYGRSSETSTRIVEAAVAVGTLNSIDPRLLLSIAEQESGFNRNARSGDGSYGLMQIRYRIHRKRIQSRSVFRIQDSFEIACEILNEYGAQTNIKRALYRYSGGSQKYVKQVLDRMRARHSTPLLEQTAYDRQQTGSEDRGQNRSA